MLDISKFARIIKSADDDYAARIKTLEEFAEVACAAIRESMRNDGFEIGDGDGKPAYDLSPENFGGLRIFRGMEYGGLIFNLDEDRQDGVRAHYLCPYCGGRIILSSDVIKLGRELAVIHHQEERGQITFGGHQCYNKDLIAHARLAKAHAAEVDAQENRMDATTVKARQAEFMILLEAIEGLRC